MIKARVVLPRPGAVYQDVVYRLAPGQCRGQGDLQVAPQFLLTHEVSQSLGPQPRFQPQIIRLEPGIDDAFFLAHVRLMYLSPGNFASRTGYRGRNPWPGGDNWIKFLGEGAGG
jgi:hypothetical protein